MSPSQIGYLAALLDSPSTQYALDSKNPHIVIACRAGSTSDVQSHLDGLGFVSRRNGGHLLLYFDNEQHQGALREALPHIVGKVTRNLVAEGFGEELVPAPPPDPAPQKIDWNSEPIERPPGNAGLPVVTSERVREHNRRVQDLSDLTDEEEEAMQKIIHEAQDLPQDKELLRKWLFERQSHLRNPHILNMYWELWTSPEGWLYDV